MNRHTSKRVSLSRYSMAGSVALVRRITPLADRDVLNASATELYCRTSVARCARRYTTQYGRNVREGTARKSVSVIAS